MLQKFESPQRNDFLHVPESAHSRFEKFEKPVVEESSGEQTGVTDPYRPELKPFE